MKNDLLELNKFVNNRIYALNTNFDQTFCQTNVIQQYLLTSLDYL